MIRKCVVCALLCNGLLSYAGEPKSLHPQVKKVVDGISQERIAATLKKLESFGTRNTLSDASDPSHGIGAARRWIFQELQSYGPRLQVSYDRYMVKKKDRITRDVELVNVVAVLPGTTQRNRHVIVSGHYDSLTIVRKKDAEADAPDLQMDNEASAASPIAPGVTDDSSGTAAVLELARVMSQMEFEKTIVFVAFAGEEQGLVGSSLYAAKAKRENVVIDGVFNNDIIGSDVSGNGRRANDTINLYSDDPNDSPSRSLARYIKETSERYLPAMNVRLIFRNDRFARGGDHTPFNVQGYPAVRFTTPTENFANQHSITDNFENTSPSYTARVCQVNGAALASLALAPSMPVTTREVKTGVYKGKLAPNLARGKSGYDALLKWTHLNPEADVIGYVVVLRSTTSSFWEKEIFVGKATEYTLPNLSIDEVVLGVKAIDADGLESPVSAYVVVPRPLQQFEAEELPMSTAP